MKKKLKIFLLYISLVLVFTSCVSTNTRNKKEDESEVVTKKYVRDGLEISEAEAKREEESSLL